MSKRLSLIIYNLGIHLYGFGILVASLFNPKARKWVNGRKHPIPAITKKIGEKTIWFHCSSLGEFEQARPLIEKIRTDYPLCKIVLTFFSPSGYEVRKNYEKVDLVLYLPLDTKANALDFLNKIHPDLALFVKNEFWYNYAAELKKKLIPVVLFSAILRDSQVFFKPYGGIFRDILGMFDQIFVQNSNSQKLLQSINIKSEVAPDTRFDRVAQVAANHKKFPAIDVFRKGSKLFIAGSTYSTDEEMLLKCIAEDVIKEYKYIIAPHDLEQERINALIRSMQVKAIRLSELTSENASAADVIIVDTMGDLSSIYAYGHIAYVGGGFNGATHNVLEPAAYGIPVIIGPEHTKAVEAIELVRSGGALVVNSYSQLKAALIELTSSPQKLERCGQIAGRYVGQSTGGTEKVTAAIGHFLA